MKIGVFTKKPFLAFICAAAGGILALTSPPLPAPVAAFPPLRPAITFHYACHSGDDPNSLSCLELHYQTLTRTRGTTVALADVKAAYLTNPNIRSDCHELLHVVGRTTADQTTDLTDAYTHGDNFCSSGYYHGVIESITQRIGLANLPSAIPYVCAAIRTHAPFSLNHHNCLHGLGHGIFDMTGNLFTSLQLCDTTGVVLEQEWCYSGIFMQNQLNGMDPSQGFAYLRNDEPMYPCNVVGDVYKYQCYLMQTSHALQLADGDYNHVFRECAAVESQYQAPCYQSIGYSTVGLDPSTTPQTETDCELGQNSYARQNCVEGAVRNLVTFHQSDDQADAMCRTLEPFLKPDCYSSTADDITHLNTDALHDLGVDTGLLWWLPRTPPGTVQTQSLRFP